jgi:hypothetical protein
MENSPQTVHKVNVQSNFWEDFFDFLRGKNEIKKLLEMIKKTVP